MNEFDLQMLERELMAWQRRLERQAPGPLTSALDELWAELRRLRAGGANAPGSRHELASRAALKDKLAALRLLYEAYTQPQPGSEPLASLG